MNDDPHTDPELDRVAERLRASRPVPHPAFRGELGRRLGRRAAREARPRWLPHAVAGYAASGSLLLCLATFGVLGIGPLAAG